MPRRTRLAAGAALAIVIALGGAIALGTHSSSAPATNMAATAAAPPPLEFTPNDLARLESHALGARLDLPGTIAAIDQATVRAKTSAEVRRVTVREGDRVVAGQILVELDTAQLRQTEAERTAAVDSAQARLTQAEDTRTANATLLKQGFISPNAAANADATFRAQKAALDAAQAQLAEIRIQLADAVVRAPLSGLVAQRDVQPGEKVNFDAPLLTIVDLSRLEVRAQAPVNEVARIAIGSSVAVEVDGVAGPPIIGRVERINPSADAGSRTIAVYVAIPNEAERLRSGMFAHVRVAGGEARTSLPAAAVHEDDHEAYVWLLAGDKVVRRAVQIGQHDTRSQRVEILGGVDAADRVIALRIDGLADGAPARLVEHAPAAQASADAAAAAAASAAPR